MKIRLSKLSARLDNIAEQAAAINPSGAATLNAAADAVASLVLSAKVEYLEDVVKEGLDKDAAKSFFGKEVKDLKEVEKIVYDITMTGLDAEKTIAGPTSRYMDEIKAILRGSGMSPKVAMDTAEDGAAVFFLAQFSEMWAYLANEVSPEDFGQDAAFADTFVNGADARDIRAAVADFERVVRAISADTGVSSIYVDLARALGKAIEASGREYLKTPDIMDAMATNAYGGRHAETLPSWAVTDAGEEQKKSDRNFSAFKEKFGGPADLDALISENDAFKNVLSKDALASLLKEDGSLLDDAIADKVIRALYDHGGLSLYKYGSEPPGYVLGVKDQTDTQLTVPISLQGISVDSVGGVDLKSPLNGRALFDLLSDQVSDKDDLFVDISDAASEGGVTVTKSADGDVVSYYLAGNGEYGVAWVVKDMQKFGKVASDAILNVGQAQEAAEEPAEAPAPQPSEAPPAKRKGKGDAANLLTKIRTDTVRIANKAGDLAWLIKDGPMWHAVNQAGEKFATRPAKTALLTLVKSLGWAKAGVGVA